MIPQTLRYRNWEFESANELTMVFYEEQENGSAEKCGCDNCKNFASSRNQIYPEEVRQLFIDLGIDFKKELEVTHFALMPNGLHFYEGCFYFNGKIINGKDCLAPVVPKGWVNELIEINEHFKIGFSENSELTTRKENFVQVVFSTNIPWILETEFEL